jgi:hypothetical protein
LEASVSILEPLPGIRKFQPHLAGSWRSERKVSAVCYDLCSSFWFYRFLEGACHQMGQDWWPDKAIPIELLLILLESTEFKIQEAITPHAKNRWLVFHAYVAVCYTLSLRGSEGFLLDLAGLNRKFAVRGDQNVVVALLGKVKEESDDWAHLLPCVPITSSGINVKLLCRG